LKKKGIIKKRRLKIRIKRWSREWGRMGNQE
jgi:hypothetical protein